MNPYFEQTILNADPIELIRMLYQRAIHCVRDARQHLAQKRIAERAAAINKAYLAIQELLGALRPESAPELCQRLHALYSHMLQRLLDANLQQADEPLAEVLGLLVTLAEGWSGAAVELTAKEEPPAAGDNGQWGEAGSERTSRFVVNA
jgi:flagellar protein FliS